MLPVKNRLKKKKDFEKIFKKGKGAKESFLFLKWISNNLSTSRFGFVVGKKISKKATLRNKIKRRLREAVRAKLPSIKKGLDGIVVACPGLEKKNFRQTKETIDRLFLKARIITKNKK